MPDKPHAPMRVSRARLARMTGKTPQAVSQWVADGMPHTGGGRGKALTIDLDQALPWLIDNRGAAPGSERERLAKEQADKLALQNAQTRRELIRSEHVAWFVGEALAQLKELIMNLPGRLATKLASIEDPAVARSELLSESTRILESYQAALEKVMAKPD